MSRKEYRAKMRKKHGPDWWKKDKPAKTKPKKAMKAHPYLEEWAGFPIVAGGLEESTILDAEAGESYTEDEANWNELDYSDGDPAGNSWGVTVKKKGSKYEIYEWGGPYDETLLSGASRAQAIRYLKGLKRIGMADPHYPQRRKNPRKGTYEEWKASYVPSVVEQAKSTFFRIGNYVLVEPPRHHARTWKKARWQNTKTGEWATIAALGRDGKYLLAIVPPGKWSTPKVIGNYASMKGAVGALSRRDKMMRATKNPRKISEQAARALMAGKKFKSGNTQVKMLVHGLYDLTLHGNSIAVFDVHHQELMVRDGGYPSMTTKERLNALPNVQVQTKKGQLYLNGKKWNGDTVLVISEGVPVFPYKWPSKGTMG